MCLHTLGLVFDFPVASGAKQYWNRGDSGFRVFFCLFPAVALVARWAERIKAQQTVAVPIFGKALRQTAEKERKNTPHVR